MSPSRSGRRLPPPPSPIPTGKGSRSAGNQIFSEYLETALQVPELSLPEPHVVPAVNGDHGNIVPPEINYRSLECGEGDSTDFLFVRAMDLGGFRLTCHGVFPGEVLERLVNEADHVFRVLELKDGFDEKIRWGWSSEGRSEWASSNDVGERSFQELSENMEKIGSKLYRVAEKLCKLLEESRGDERELGKMMIQPQNCVLSLYRYSNSNKTPCPGNDHALCLRLPTRLCQFHVLSPHQGPSSFDAGPDTIVVALGKHIQESGMEFVCKPRLVGRQASGSCFFIELKCMSASKNSRISIRDQILVGLVLFFLYRIYSILFH